MPLSEFYKMSTGQRATTSSADLSHLPGNEFVELVWENSQIVMQGQTTRPRKTSTSSIFQSQIQKSKEKGLRNAVNSKMGKFGVMDCVLNDFATPREMGFDQDDDMNMMPWLNYPVDDSLPQDYSSELLPELSSVAVSEISSQTIRGSNYVQNGLGLEQENVANDSSSAVGSRSGQIFPWSFQGSQMSIPSTGLKIQKPDSVLPNTNSGIMNFSHFSRPAALVHADLRNVSAIATPSTLGIEVIGCKKKGPAPSSTNLSESTLMNLSSGLSRQMDSNSQLNTEELCAAQQSEVVCGEDAFKNDKLLNQVGGENTVEPVAASSSLCSGNSAERASNDLTNNLKRKFGETDDFEGQSEDAEEESVGIRKGARVRRCAGSKRSRAAEVHNLSERRRRDRINEKMRALQELIPNCNKVDKASMLDEAIEYLKTLQLQVQIMSMGSGMYVPPMMFPTGMTHLHAPHMTHFSPMGMGFGMGMIDMNGGSPGCPMIQVPPFHGVHFPAPRPAPFFGPTSFQGMGGPNLQALGHPEHCVPFAGGDPMNSAMDLNASRVAASGEVPTSASSSNRKDQNANSQNMDNANANSSMNHTYSQASNTYLGHSSVGRSDQAGTCQHMNLAKGS